MGTETAPGGGGATATSVGKDSGGGGATASPVSAGMADAISTLAPYFVCVASNGKLDFKFMVNLDTGIPI